MLRRFLLFIAYSHRNGKLGKNDSPEWMYVLVSSPYELAIITSATK